MADEPDAVHRTPRPTGDHQTPETAPQGRTGTTITPSPVSGDQPGLREDVSGELRASAPGAFCVDGCPCGQASEAAAACALDTATDVEAYAALPECTACGGTGKDTNGSPFETPLAVHFAGPPVKAEGRQRQLCMWCGHVLSDLPSRKGETAPSWPAGALVRIEDGLDSVVPYEGGELPPGCCALPDDEGVDPVDGYATDLCGKHTGTCSNRCLLPADHAGECDDDPPKPGPGCYPPVDGWDGASIAADDGPDEAQETRAADWPAHDVREPEDGDRD